MLPNIHFSNMLARLCCMFLKKMDILKSPGGLEHYHLNHDVEYTLQILGFVC